MLQENNKLLCLNVMFSLRTVENSDIEIVMNRLPYSARDYTKMATHSNMPKVFLFLDRRLSVLDDHSKT